MSSVETLGRLMVPLTVFAVGVKTSSLVYQSCISQPESCTLRRVAAIGRSVIMDFTRQNIVVISSCVSLLAPCMSIANTILTKHPIYSDEPEKHALRKAKMIDAEAFFREYKKLSGGACPSTWDRIRALNNQVSELEECKQTKALSDSAYKAWIQAKATRKQLSSESIEYKEALEKSFTGEVKKEIQPLLDRIGIRKDLIFAEKNGNVPFQAIGSNYFTQGDAIVQMSPGFYLMDKNLTLFVVKHEISHIKNNDAILEPLVAAISFIATAIFLLSQKIDISCTALLSSFVGAVAFVAYAQYVEARADDFAIAESSIEELKGARRFFISFQQPTGSQGSLVSLFSALLRGGSGVDAMHPSLESRIKKIEHALQQQMHPSDFEELKIQKEPPLVLYAQERISEDYLTDRDWKS